MAGPLEGADWEKVKQTIISRISPDEIPDAELKKELFDRILDEENDNIRYCIEVMTVLVFRMRKSKQRQFFIENLPIILPQTETSNRSGLILIGGFALGLLADESAQDQVWSQELINHVKQYQLLVAAMDAASCQHLTVSLTEVFAALGE